jgi:hypothetical protein
MVGRLTVRWLLHASTSLFLGTRPATTDERSDLKAQMKAMTSKIEELEAKRRQIEAAQRAAPPPAAPGPTNLVTGGDFPGSLKLAGATTSVKIGDYVKGDAIFDANTPLGGDETDFSAIPLDRTTAANRQDKPACRRGSRASISRRARRRSAAFTPSPLRLRIRRATFSRSRTAASSAGLPTSLRNGHTTQAGPISPSPPCCATSELMTAPAMPARR